MFHKGQGAYAKAATRGGIRGGGGRAMQCAKATGVISAGLAAQRAGRGRRAKPISRIKRTEAPPQWACTGKKKCTAGGRDEKLGNRGS